MSQENSKIAKDGTKPASPDSLTKTASIALSESALAEVSGGGTINTIQDVTVNKSKTADKAAAQLDAYIRG